MGEQSNFEIRKVKRKAWCRVCDAILVRDESDVFYTYSCANRGQNILICLPCIEEIGKEVKKYKNNENIL